MNDIIPHPDTLLQRAYILNGPDRCQAMSPADAPRVLQSDTLGWVHLSAGHAETPGWIVDNLSYLDESIVDALVTEETRPRVTRVGDGLIVILRGINTIDGEAPEDMVAVRLWIDPNRIISLSRRRVRAVEDIANMIESGQGPEDASEFLRLLSERLNVRIEAFWRDFDDTADALEEQVLDGGNKAMRQQVADLRRQTVVLRRYLQPQRDAVRHLLQSAPDWIQEDDHRQMGEELDALQRLVEDIDAMRDRLALVRDELSGQLSDTLNQNMYLISILSAVFLPLGFLTGLFGINLAGMPGAAHEAAFWIFTASLAVLVAVQIVVFRKLRWI
ncbi:zinc transporter [Sagittula marina]|uniref:Zinc transporter n=1 Tax=Sagittula marina TaxID=943940 RepID=A0A7W6DUE8_9RHOB|nr:zinc transporter ZntB [Sagittula marina]MBB3986308.1 zinc transporter [Sagittula marina]